MSSAQTRSQKSKAGSKMTGSDMPVAATSKQGKTEVRPQSGAGTSMQERQMLIARAAYFRAEKRGFAPGCELQDWVEAEAEVLRLIGNA